MGFDIDFGALQTANPFAAYAKGQEIGQERRQQQARQQAGNVFASDPEKAAQILLNSGDLAGGMELHKYGQGVRQEAARRGALSKAAGGDLKGAQADALSAGDVETYNAITKMDETQRADAKDRAEKLAAVGQWVSKLPYEQRRAAIQQQKGLLVEQGLPAEQIDSFDPTDQNIQGFTSQALGLKGLLEQADKERKAKLEEAQFDETKRHNKAGEGIAARNANTAAYSAQTGRMSYEARKAAGGFGTPGVGGAFPTLPGSPEDYEITPAGGR